MSTRIPRLFVILLGVGASNAFLPSPKQHQPQSTQLKFFFKNQQEEPAPKKVPKPAVEEEPDLVEKLFTLFFGKPEESPLGLKRFDENRFPEQVSLCA